MPSKRFKMGHRKSADHEGSSHPSDDQYHTSPYSNPPPFAGIWEPTSSLPRQIDETDNDYDAILRAYGVQLSQTTCGICKVALLPDYATAFEHAQKLLENNASGYVGCRACGAHTCIGCGMMPRTRRSGELGLCCDNARLFCIWLWLCALETLGTRNEGAKALPASPQDGNSASMGRRQSMLTRKPNGTGYGGHNSYGHGMLYYESDELPPVPHGAPPFAHTKARRPARDSMSAPSTNHETTLLPRLFNALKTLCPDFTHSMAFDKTPPPLLAIMLKRSQLLETIATLLRTDNFEDVATRFELYGALLDFMGRLVQHPMLLALITGSRLFYSTESGFGLLHATMPSPGNSNSMRKEPELVTPLISLVDKFYHATQKISKQARNAQEDFEDQDGQSLLKVCIKTDTLFRTLQVNAKACGLNPDDTSGGLSVAVSPSQQMTQWHRENCVEAVDDERFKDFHFTKDRARKDQPPKGRMKRLLTELATLQSSLPEGIFVRYASSRPDLMKILIIGPQDTPYEQGLFEFDLVCPIDYPQSPPKMHFRTTGKGQAHFNPNLYPDGKVCLSLLGTWSGPSWMPNESTILQVLVSIQAMVFCAEPWYNEPGRESREMEEHSKRFNVEIYSMTIPYALTEPLKEAGKKRKDKKRQHYRVWQDVAEKHFRTYGGDIHQKLKDWQKKAEELPDRSDRRYPFAPAPGAPPPMAPFATAIPTNLLPAAPITPYTITYVPHPQYSTSPNSETVSLGYKLAALANQYGCPLVKLPIPTPGATNEMKFIVDPAVPFHLGSMIIDAAEKTGFPLVVPSPPPLYGTPNFAHQDHTPKFETFKHVDSVPDFDFGPDIHFSSPGPSVPSIHHPVIPEPPISPLPQETAPTPVAATKAKSYAEVAAAAKTEVVKTQADAGHLAPTHADLAKFEGKTDGKLSKETTYSNQLAESHLPMQYGAGFSGWGSSTIDSFKPMPAQHLPPLVPFGSMPAPSIPSDLLEADDPTLLTEFLGAVISQFDSIKHMFPPTNPNHVAIIEKQESLIAKANTNKAKKVYTLGDFAGGSTLTESDLDDDIPVYEPSRGKISLEKLIQDYEVALKEFLNDA